MGSCAQPVGHSKEEVSHLEVVVMESATHTVTVTGGTGHLGRDVVDRLKPAYRVRVLARSPGSDPEVEWFRGDLATGEGVDRAVAGARTLVHLATLSPAARRGYLLPQDFWRSPPEVDVDGTRRLLESAARHGVEHVLYVSVVGADRPRGPYLHVKRAAEELVRDSGVPRTILRATQFHWLLDRILGRAACLPVLLLPVRMRAQPVDTADFAGYLAEQVDAGPVGEDFAGPELLTLGELAEQWQLARGTHRRVVRLPSSAGMEKAAYAMTSAHGRRGTTTWEQWLAVHPPE